MLFDSLIQHRDLILSIGIFSLTFVGIVFEVFDKAVVAISGAILLLLLGVLSFEQAIESINFEIVALLGAMMIIVEIAQESGLFTMLNFKLAKYSKGNPFLIFCFLLW
ncbi:hypothetical protein IPJ72_02785 [Candidatus Peregrinibacteria bacterium]|nr:MAG: hypothetical protein IPJ72_02785 [Candidatus Peregrinibacteria bacterium]